jgi:glycosyl transferase family 87
MTEKSAERLPPIWLSASALTAAIAVVFGIGRWIDHFRADPSAQDIRVWIVAAHIGLTHGWSHIYDLGLQRAQAIDLAHIYLSPPPSAWAVVPLVGLSTPAAYVVWTLINVAIFIAVGWLVCPGAWFTKVTLILVGLALWPVHYQFWLGQWVVVTIGLVGLSWWLLDHDRHVAGGVALALAMCAKPQDAWLVPVALLVSGRWRAVVPFAAAAGALASASLVSLGPSGVSAWMNDVALARANPFTGPMTYSSLFGHNALATGVEILFGLLAVALAWHRRDRLDLVFALGLLGTLGSASYLHEDDIAMLVLAAWIVLRAQPSVRMKLWLLAGIAAAQFISIGMPIPMLLWEPVWLIVLVLEPRQKTEAAPARRLPEPVTA